MRFGTFLAMIFAIFALIFGYNYLTRDKSDSNTRTQINAKPMFGSKNPKIVNLKKEIVSTMKNLHTTLEGIKDVSSAKKATVSLMQISKDLNGYLDRMKDIPEDDKLQIKKYMMDFVKYLKASIKRLSTIEGVPQVIDPAIDKIDSVLMYYKPI